MLVKSNFADSSGGGFKPSAWGKNNERRNTPAALRFRDRSVARMTRAGRMSQRDRRSPERDYCRSSPDAPDEDLKPGIWTRALSPRQHLSRTRRGNMQEESEESPPASFLQREREVKGRPLPWLRFDPNLAAVPFDDFLAKRQSDAGAGIFLPAVQALKEDENAPEILGRDPDPIVPDRKLPFQALAFDLHLNHWRLRAAELDRVADQVLEQLGELDRVPLDARQGVMGYDCAAFFDSQLEVGKGPVQDLLHRHGFERFALGSHSRIGQQSDDERLHALRAVQGESDEFIGIVGQFPSVALAEKLQIIRYHAEGFLEVMRSDVSELFKFFVGSFQLGGARHHPLFQIFVQGLQFHFGPLAFQHAPLQRPRHLIERPRQLQQFPFSVGQPGAHFQVPFPQPVGRSNQRPDLAQEKNVTTIPGGEQGEASGGAQKEKVPNQRLIGRRMRRGERDRKSVV